MGTPPTGGRCCAVDAGRAQMHEPASDTAGVKATVFTRVCLEQLRKELQAFATDRNRDQYHTPRNLLLALIAEVSLCTSSAQVLQMPVILRQQPHNALSRQLDGAQQIVCKSPVAYR